MAKVLKDFYLKTKTPEAFYEKDGVFPKEGTEATPEILFKLSTPDNRSASALIELSEKEQKLVDDFKVAKEHVEVEEKPEVEQNNEVVESIEDFTMDQLKEIAKLEGTEFKSSDNKATLIQKIEANRK